ncbi:MAG: DUF5329 family protein [Pseudomonadales bacterium]|nr:DUF5329 family protein [Pseudomonadales bacterium]
MKLFSPLFLLLLLSVNAYADTNKEIDHLLTYVATTDCSYERNGTMHTGKEAVAHIKKKYDYYADDVESTEDFIQYSATKSKLSGKHYIIHCKHQAAVKSSEWLLLELARFRRQGQ